MTFTPVDKLPEKRKSPYKKLTDHLDEFMNMDVKYARVNYTTTEYVSYNGAHNAISVAIRNGGYPIELKGINGELYLIRKDLEEVSA